LLLLWLSFRNCSCKFPKTLFELLDLGLEHLSAVFEVFQQDLQVFYQRNERFRTSLVECENLLPRERLESTSIPSHTTKYIKEHARRLDCMIINTPR